MKKVIVSIGIPGSGKSTILRKFAEKHGYTYICPDDIRMELTGDPADQTRNRAVWSETRKRTREALGRNETVVVDATFANAKQRQDFIDTAREAGAEKVQGLYFNVPIDIAKDRNSNRERVVPEYVLDRMQNFLEKSAPNVENEFDSLFTLDEQGELTEVRANIQGRSISREFKMR